MKAQTDMDIKLSPYILFTGAGFTHNIGTPLSQDMWAEIFNNRLVQSTPRVKDLMLRDADFESVYNSIIEGNYSDDEKDVISKAVLTAYENLDTIVRQWIFNSTGPNQLNIYKLQEFISSFAGKNGKGFYFTLNQDLFLERKYYNGVEPVLPAIQRKSNWFTTHFNNQLTAQDYCRLPTKNELNAPKINLLVAGNYFYIKLHGSYNWLSSSGSQRLVIGRNKLNQINQEPLLAYYFELFENVLSTEDKRLLIIGYGFRDEHINEVLADSVENHGLQIHIVTPVSFSSFQSTLSNAPYGSSILKGISGYYQHNLVQIFPPDQSESQAKRTLYESFFS